MHYLTYVLIRRDREDLDAAVLSVLRPHREPDDDGDYECPDCGGFWDWHQIGGRWTGILSGYDPEKDPANLKPDGSPKWPTSWARHAGDVLPVRDALLVIRYQSLYGYALVWEGHCLPRQCWDGNKLVKSSTFEQEMLEVMTRHEETHVVVVVDCHS
jgi:hypothetical protein